MFIPVDFASVNSPQDLAPGSYSAVCTGYGREGDDVCAFLFSYTATGAVEPAAYDLMVIAADNAIRARDFLWLADRSWRDSDGTKANEIAALLPAEILHLPVSGERQLPAVVVP